MFADVNLLISKTFSYLNKNFWHYYSQLFPYDFWSDDSYQKVIFVWNGFNNKLYKPNDLVYLKDKYIFNASYHQLRKIPAIALSMMAKDFYNKFWVKLSVRSAYRSYYQQLNLWNNWYKAYVAVPWYSEHQAWLAVDLFYVSNSKLKMKASTSKYYDRLQNNAYKYWFINSYQKWIKIDWFPKEPWHWRYVWNKLAKYLYDNHLTLIEYYKNWLHYMHQKWYLKDKKVLFN